eukprot:m.22289 g.22289  ORF g.22289 m.22289 type:complete len:562 (-) comp10696_c0_seq1:271-1956(-)
MAKKRVSRPEAVGRGRQSDGTRTNTPGWTVTPVTPLLISVIVAAVAVAAGTWAGWYHIVPLSDERSDLPTCDAQGLVRWLRENGAYIHASLRVSECATTASMGTTTSCVEGERGVFAAETIADGTTLFNIPDALCLVADAEVTPTKPTADPLRTIYLRDDRTATAYTQLAATLVRERRRGMQSAYWQYISCLPPLNECMALPCFTDDEHDALADGYAASIGKGDRRKLIVALRTALRGDSKDTQQQHPTAADENELIWAYGMVLSRAFVVGGIPRLIPFVDMLNHDPLGGGITIGPGSASNADTTRPTGAVPTGTAQRVGAWTKRADTHTAAGDEVKWAYKTGATPFDLLYLYGIVDARPQHGAVSVDLQWQAPTTAASTLNLVVRLFRAIDATNVAPLPRASGTRPILRITLAFEEGRLVPATLGFCRVIALADALAKGDSSSALERAAAEKFLAQPDGSRRAMAELVGPPRSRPLGSRVETAALQALLGVLISEMSTENTDSASPITVASANLPNESPRLVVARAFRRQRARVLESTRRLAYTAFAAVAPSPSLPDLYA